MLLFNPKIGDSADESIEDRSDRFRRQLDLALSLKWRSQDIPDDISDNKKKVYEARGQLQGYIMLLLEATDEFASEQFPDATPIDRLIACDICAIGINTIDSYLNSWEDEIKVSGNEESACSLALLHVDCVYGCMYSELKMTSEVQLSYDLDSEIKKAYMHFIDAINETVKVLRDRYSKNTELNSL